MEQLLDQINTSQNDNYSNYTAQEITHQPQSWRETWQKICDEQASLNSFCEKVLSEDNINIVLTGAGSSAYVGDVAAHTWQECFKQNARAIPTTDLVTHFEDEINVKEPLLLISFARSGNSPESTAAVRLANQKCNQVYHLIITCNPNGRLAAMEPSEHAYVFLLPPAAEDQGLAMTNSFTSMLLAVIGIPKLLTGNMERIEAMIAAVAEHAEMILTDFIDQLYEVAKIDFNRIVFLGSGPNWGIARESHLKVQEFTNGNIIGKYDSFLGFRHGPKSVINNSTLLVYLFSNQNRVQPYEKDLAEQLNKQDIGLATLAVSSQPMSTVEADYTITLDAPDALDEALWAIICVLPAQIIGFFKSVLLNYNPDNPSPDGTIARVVEGVTIYPHSGS